MEKFPSFFWWTCCRLMELAKDSTLLTFNKSPKNNVHSSYLCQNILYPKQSNFIYNVSFLSLISSIYAIYNKHYGIALLPGGVFITSINYWRKPDYSWRRYFDISYVIFALNYQIILSYKVQYYKEYYLLTFCGIGFFILGVNYYKKKNYWMSTYCHIMLHVMANIGNIILYSGSMKPPGVS